jgi:hypothetical protein
MVLLPHTLFHYRSRFPNAKFIIIDNESTDASVEIARAAGCEIYKWETNNISNIIEHTKLKNNIWKTAETDWIIITDMDEWLEITEEQLSIENEKGVTIIKTRGIQIIGNSESLVLDDINLHSLKDGILDKAFDKTICFKRSQIIEINFKHGAHSSSPNGIVNYSSKQYILKHMNFLGFPWYEHKMILRYSRTHANRKIKASVHYTINTDEIRSRYDDIKLKVVSNILYLY